MRYARGYFLMCIVVILEYRQLVIIRFYDPKDEERD